MKHSKEKYIQFCENNIDIPLFIQPWWLDAVCDNKKKWDVILYEKDNTILGVLIYHFIQKWNFNLILQLPLTQYNGIWLKPKTYKNSNEKLVEENKIIRYLVNELDTKNFDFYSQNHPLTFTNWLPFYWKNYKQTTRYTYQIKDISNPESCYNDFSYAKRKQIKKVKDKLFLSNTTSFKDFYSGITEYYSDKNQKFSYSYSFFEKIYKKAKQRGQGDFFSVIDKENNIHASLFIVWDNKTAYNLVSYINPKYKSSGGSTLVVFEAIKALATKIKIFDFEGSMIQGVEKSFRGFATVQVPYFNITKSNSKLLSILLKAYNFFN